MNEDERTLQIEILGLRRDLLKEVAHRTHQWGQAIANLLDRDVEAKEQPRSSRMMRDEAASLFTIAGSYRMLLSTDLSRRSMGAAAAHCAANENTLAYPLAICAGEPGIAWGALEALRTDLTAEERANTLLALSWTDLVGDRRAQARGLLREHLELGRAAGQATVGRMRIPLEAIVRVVDAADRLAHDEGALGQLRGSLHDALLRMHDVTAAAMADRYHWQKLMSAVLPVEPEAAAVGGVAMAAAMRAGAEHEVLERIDLPPRALVPLRIGGGLAERAL